MNNKLYPVLEEGWVIRGTKEIPRLFNIYTNKIVRLNNEVVEYILDCNGSLCYRDIINKYNIESEVVHSFYKKFLDEGIIKECPSSTLKNISINLGPNEPWLKEVHIDVTNNCNLRCKHCFWGNNLKNEKNAPLEQWLHFIDDIKNIGVAKVVLSGGEAFTNHDLLEIIKHCYNNEIMISSIFTNGTIYNDDVKKIVDFVTRKQLTLAFYISLDGCNEEQHDFIRGKGNFEKTINFIKMLNENKEKNNGKYQIMINSLLHKKNSKNLVKWYDYLESLGVYGWRFTTGRVSGFFKENVDLIQVTSKDCFNEYKLLINHLIRKIKNNEKVLYLNIENFFTTKALLEKKMYIFDENLPICDYKSNACSVDPKGNVQFCTGWQSKKFGNVFENKIEDIWYCDELMKLKQMKIKEIKECQDCKHLKYCGGGCRLECKDIYSKDEKICENFELFENEMLPILTENEIEFVVE